MTYKTLEKAFNYFKVEDYHSAIKEYAQALTILPTKHHFLIFSNQGLAYMNLERYNQAIQCFILATENCPEHYESHHNLAVSFLCVGDVEKGLKSLNTCLNIQPDFIPSICAKILVLCNQNKVSDAIEHLKKSQRHLKENDTATDVLFLSTKAFLSMKANNLDQSVELFHKVTSLQPNSTEALKDIHARSLQKLAAKVFKQGKVDLSVEYLQRSAKMFPTAERFYELGVLLTKAGSNLKRIFSSFESALRLDENHFKALESAGMVAIKSEEFGKAIRFLRRCIELEPKNQRCRLNLALALLKQGDMAESQRHFKILLEINPNHTEAEHALQMTKMYLAANPSALRIRVDDYNDKFSIGLESKTFDGLPSEMSLFTETKDLDEIVNEFGVNVDFGAMFNEFESDLKSMKSMGTLEKLVNLGNGNNDDISLNSTLFDFKKLEVGSRDAMNDFETANSDSQVHENDESFEVEVRIYSIEELKSMIGQEASELRMKGVIPGRFEESLDDEEFEKHFSTKRESFYALDASAQENLRRSIGF